MLVLSVLAAPSALAQTGWVSTARTLRPDWRQIGNSGVEISLASPVSGPVERVWFSPDGSRLVARTRSGRAFETADMEKWIQSAAVAPERSRPAVGIPPEPGAEIQAQPLISLRLYAFGRQVYRSDDGGLSWTNLTEHHHQSIIGGEIHDLAVSPLNPDELVVANDLGVWRSVDGGLCWTGLNASLPNLPVERLLALPEGGRGVRIFAGKLGLLEWMPGEKQAWRPAPEAEPPDNAIKRALSSELRIEITAVATAGNYIYAGGVDGSLWVSPDGGRVWRLEDGLGAAVNAIFIDPEQPQLALAALDPVSGDFPTPRVLRTTNGGLFWDDLTTDLPRGAVRGITADTESGAIYVATSEGVYFTRANLAAPGPSTSWFPLTNLPEAPAADIRLDEGANRLFVAVEGYGVYATLAPHRLGSLRLLNAADFSRRPAAPGSLLSVLGANIRTARAEDLNVPVLAASEEESQIQVPFEANGNFIQLALNSGNGNHVVGVPLEQVSPVIFVDRDGTPMLLDADTGVLLDGMNPARSNSRIQILAAGLGRVRPAWPTGLPAPMEDPPQVAAPVHAFLDRMPVEVTRATLAPGYVGFYLIEVQLPEIVNRGPAELYLESEGTQSNPVRIYLEP